MDQKTLDRLNGKVTVVGGLNDEHRVVWASHNTGNGRPSSESIPQDVLNLLNAEVGGRVRNMPTSDLGIWRNIQASTFNGNYAQQTIESLNNVNLNSDQFIFADMETLGTFNPGKKDKLGFYVPTEISLMHMDVAGKKAKVLSGGKIKNKYGKHNVLPMVLSPGDNAGQLEELIAKLENNRSGYNATLSPDERRTLQDLILYSNPEHFQKTEIGGIGVTLIQKQARNEQLMGAANLMRKSTINKMKAGLENLRTLGTKPENAISLMNQFMQDISTGYGGQVKLVGHNFRSFDRPAMLDFIEGQVGKHNANSKITQTLDLVKNTPYIDTLNVERTLNQNLGLFYNNTQLSYLTNVKGLMNYPGLFIDPKNPSAAHFSAFDIEMNGRLFANQLTQYDRVKQLNDAKAGTRGAKKFAKWDDTPLEAGESLFAHNGISGYNAGKYDSVFEVDKNGNLRLTNTLAGSSPLYRNNTYEIAGTYDDYKIGGKNHYATLLHNKDRGTYHFLARESLEELQNVFHQNMSFVGNPLPDHATLANESKVDAATRRYSKMFSNESGGGVGLINRMRHALNAYDANVGKLDEAALIEKVKQAGGYDFNQKWNHASDSFVRDFMTVKDRFRAELPVIDQMLKTLQNDSVFTKDKQAQAIALGKFKQIMDAEFGRNETDRIASNDVRSTLKINLGTESHNLTVSDNIDGIQQGLNRMINSGHDRETISPSTIKTRLSQVVNDLVAQGALQKETGKEIIKAAQGIGSNKSSWYLLRDIGYYLNEARKNATANGETFGLKTIALENPTKVTDTRAEKLRIDQENGSKKMKEIITRSMEEAIPFARKANYGLFVEQGSVLAGILNEHDKAMDVILSKSGVKGTLSEGKRIKEMLNDMLKSYVGKGMEASLIYGGEKRGLMMAVYSKDSAPSIRNKTAADILGMQNVATVDLPLLTGDQNIRVGSTEKIARLKVIKNRNGEYSFGNGVERILQRIGSLNGTVSNMLAEGRAKDAEAMLQGNVRRELSNLSMNATKGNLGGSKYDFDTKKSKSASWTRGGMIDLSDFAEDWFRQTYGDEQASKVTAKMEKQFGLNFVGAMGSVYIPNERGGREDVKLRFQREVEQFAKGYGIDVNSHSAKDTYVAQYLRSSRNVQDLYPFGQFNAMARENMMKSVNYMPLDRQRVEDNLAKEGFSQADIARMTKRGVVTETAVKVLGDELNFLSVRSAYMNSTEVFERFGSPSLSTYEGMAIIREDIAAAYEINRRKDIKLSSGAELHENIVKRLGAVIGGTFDPTKNLVLGDHQPVNLMDVMGGRIGGSGPDQMKVTVGGMVKDGNWTALDYYGDVNENVFIRAWDAENRTLILEQKDRLQTGDKMATTEGHRITVSLAPKEDFEKAGLKNFEVILPDINPSRREKGIQVDRAAQLAYDEMIRAVNEGRKLKQNDGKVGQIALIDGLETLQRLMNKHFGTTDALRIEQSTGQLILNEKFGLNGETLSHKKVTDFLDETGTWLSRNLTNGTTLEGQVGLALADLHKWENSIGPVESGKDGLVRWGLKEMDVIQERVGKDSHVGKWLGQYMSEITQSQSKDAQRLSNALTRTITSYGTFQRPDGEVRAGDVIIRTHATKGEFGMDETGRRGFIDSRGVVNVSAEAFDDLPMRSQKGQQLTVQDYQRTMIQMQTVNVDIFGQDGSQQGTFAEALNANHRTALLELPEGVTDHRYVRLIDRDLSAVGDMPVIKEMQQTQSRIWRLTQQYNTGAEGVDLVKTADDLRKAVDDYHEQAAHMISSARDGSLSKTLMSGHMDMSGRFKIQGINPAVAATKRYEDATAYVSRDRMAEMIAGPELGEKASSSAIETRRANFNNIAETLFDVDDMSRLSKLSNSGFEKEVLDKISQDGLYGFVGRYPTIKKDTIQVMKIAIDDTLAAGQDGYRGAMMTVGTSVKLKADFDGDFLSTVLAQYKTKNLEDRMNIHSEMQETWTRDKEIITNYYDNVLSLEIEKEAKKRNISVGKLMQDDEFRESLGGEWKAQTGGIYNLESAEARIGKQQIGFIDNTRLKLLNTTTATNEILERAGKFDSTYLTTRREHIEEFGSIFSQDLISSKKFDVEKIRREIGETATDADVENIIQRRRVALDVMKEAIANPTAQGVSHIRLANKELNLFSIDKTDTQKFSLQTMLDTLQEEFKLQGSNSGWLSNNYLGLGISEGKSIQTLSEMFNLKGDRAVKTDWMVNFMDSLDNEGETGALKQKLQGAIQRHEEMVLANLEMGAKRGYTSDAFKLGEEMLGSSVAEQSGAGFRNLASQVFGGMPEGGISLRTAGIAGAIFGGAWATSSLMRSVPTPEGNEAQQEGGIPAPIASSGFAGPTARVAQNGEDITIRISGQDASNMSSNQISALIQGELNSMMPMSVNMNLNVKDNTQNMDKGWLQGVMANALSSGFAF